MKRQTFIVLVEGPDCALQKRAFGPYRAFKTAENDAKAWDVPPLWACVLPIEDPENQGKQDDLEAYLSFMDQVIPEK